MIDKGQWCEFGQDTGVTPLLFTRSAMGFLMTKQSDRISVPPDYIKYVLLYEHVMNLLKKTND